MTPEEKNIKNKIDNLSNLDVFFNDSHLWELVEGRLDQEKAQRRLSAWYWVAASVVLVGVSFYAFLVSTITPPINIATTKTVSTTILQEPPEIIVQPKSITPKTSLRKSRTVTLIIIKDSIQSVEQNGKLLANEITKLNSIDKPLVFANTKDLLQYPIDFTAQRVTTLSLPVIPDAMMKQESFGKRALRQLKNFNTEGKIDLRELNIEPKNVWAYLERSFIHDTIKIKNKKNIKQ